MKSPPTIKDAKRFLRSNVVVAARDIPPELYDLCIRLEKRGRIATKDVWVSGVRQLHVSLKPKGEVDEE